MSEDNKEQERKDEEKNVPNDKKQVVSNDADWGPEPKANVKKHNLGIGW